MSQLRLDPLTGRWVVIASERANRNVFQPRVAQVDDFEDDCPFCPEALGNDNADVQWVTKFVANKYPAFEGNEPMAVENLGPVFTQAPASGVHEVLVFQREHKGSFADLEESQAGRTFVSLRDRIAEHATIPGLRYSQAIINHGREAGASMSHPHGQLLGMSFIPGEVHDEMAGFTRFEGNCLLCATIEAEREANFRVISIDNDVAVIAPFWSGTPYEMLIAPLRHHAHITDSDDTVVDSIGRAVRKALLALRSQVGDVPYNIVIHSAPYRSSAEFHWHAHVYPKLATRAGFELGTGVLINVVQPESAATDLREAMAQ